MSASSAETPLAAAVVQFAPTDDGERNLREIDRLTRLAASRGAGLVVLPEYSAWFAAEPGPAWVEHAEPLDGRFVQRLSALADQLDLHMVAGLLEHGEHSENPVDKAFNTVVAVAPHRGIVARYRKLHLYDAFGSSESQWVAPGDITAHETFEIGGLRVGLQTCYDVRFPEVTRRLVDAGVDVVAMPAQWVRGPLKEHHWHTLVTARALENTCFMLAADHAPTIGAGNSMIVDPMGVEVATIGDETSVALAWLSRERLDQVRRLNPALELRRFAVVPRLSGEGSRAQD